jgi:hypothetical protein
MQKLATHFKVNDPNAGSPTITLLRLLLPLGRAVIRTLDATYARLKAVITSSERVTAKPNR